MPNYKKILVATDFHDDCLPVVEKAVTITKQNDAELTIVSVIPNVPYYMSAGLSSINDIEEQIGEEIRDKLETIKNQLHIDAKIKLRYGSPKIEIIKLAKKIEADLIIIGSHGHRGVQKLLGATTNGVLNRAKCDVLVIRIKD